MDISEVDKLTNVQAPQSGQEDCYRRNALERPGLS
jgi:hypothetical protein